MANPLIAQDHADCMGGQSDCDRVPQIESEAQADKQGLAPARAESRIYRKLLFFF